MGVISNEFPTTDNCQRMSRVSTSKDDQGGLLPLEVREFQESDHSVCVVCQLSSEGDIDVAMCDGTLCATVVHVDCMTLREQERFRHCEEKDERVSVESVDWHCAACLDWEEGNSAMEKQLEADRKKRKSTKGTRIAGRQRDIPWAQGGAMITPQSSAERAPAHLKGAVEYVNEGGAKPAIESLVAHDLRADMAKREQRSLDNMQVWVEDAETSAQ